MFLGLLSALALSGLRIQRARRERGGGGGAPKGVEELPFVDRLGRPASCYLPLVDL